MDGLLLDTHTLIWMVSDEDRLGQQARDLLFDSETQKFLSPASYWELAIKIKIGKLTLTSPYDDFISEAISEYNLIIMPIELKHTSILTRLDLFHSDPFDRLLIAQASVEGIPIISVDDKFDNYPVTRLWDYSRDSESNDDSESDQEPF